MEKLILVSHGEFCNGIKDSLEMILGPQDYIYAVPLLPNEGQEDFEKKFKAQVEDGDDVTVFADLLGGTPCNVVSKLVMQGADYQVYAGMNLPMLISYVNSKMIGETNPDHIARATKGIVKVNDILNSTDDDEDE